MNDLLQGFEPMSADDWPEECVDRWPAGTLRETAKQAYDQLAVSQELRPEGLRRGADGATLVKYRAQIPQQWVRDLLRRAEQEIKKA